jgi:hypothetical protein
MLQNNPNPRFTASRQNQFVNHTAQFSGGVRSNSKASLRLARSSDRAGNTQAAATSLGTFPGARSLQDSVSAQDADFYSFTFDAVSNVRIQLVNSSRQDSLSRTVLVDGKVFTSKRTKQTGSLKPREAIDNTYRRILPGTYFLKIQSRSPGKTQYKLSISISTAPPEDCGCGG